MGCHTLAHENKGPGPKLNGDEGGDVGFRGGGGPDDLAGRTGTLSWRARLQARWQARWQQETARQEEMWHGFAQQPGTHLLWEQRAGRGELRTAEQQTIAAVRGRIDFEGRLTVSAGGRSFTAKHVIIPPGWPSSWPPGLAEIIRQPEAPGQKLTRAVVARVQSLRELVDETDTPVLYTHGKHLNHRARASITFPDQRWLEFPVEGTRRTNAIMTAVDQDGNKVARYRAPKGPGPVEITVHPDWTLTDELVLVIAISAPWFLLYFYDEWAPGPAR